MRPNILFLLHLPPPVHGSSMVGKYIKESKIINENINADYINLLASRSVNETGKISIKKIVGLTMIWFALLRRLLKEKPDLCYLALSTTGIAFFKDVSLIVLLKLFRVKRVYHLHNKGVSKKKDHFLYRALYRYAFKGAHIILLSKRLYQDIEYFVPKSKVFICPNGIPEIRIKDKKAVKEGPVKVLFLSNLIESKGIFVLLDALAKLKNKGLHLECNIIGGEGDVTGKMLNARICDLNLENNVFYLGKKYGHEKHLYLRDSDIFVFPTFYKNECFPLTILEAMQFSLPVISTNEGGIPDIVEDNITGFIVKKRNAVDLSDKIEKLLKNAPLRKKMGQKGKEKFTSLYRLEIFEKKLCEILKKI